jgi:2TM domain
MTTEDRTPTSTSPDGQLRERAIKRLRAQADFRTHLMIYLAVNAFLVVIWVWNDNPFFWPIFPIVGWGIGVVANAWEAFRSDRITEDRIRREIDRMR